MVVAQQRFRGGVAHLSGRVQGQARLLGALLILVLAATQAGFSQCTKGPTVWMNERTAASHLLKSIKFVFPADVPTLAQIRSVVVIVTVNRKGRICEANAAAGPTELRQSAEKIVRSSWRYRPFLLDRKPVVVQFPVTVNFVLSADKRDAKVPEIAGILPENAIPILRTSSGAPRT